MSENVNHISTVVQTSARANVIGKTLDYDLNEEIAFVDSLSQVKSGEFRGQNVVDIMYDGTFSPLAIRRQNDRQSTMLLQNMRLIPGQVGILRAGVLVNVDEGKTEMTQTGSIGRGDWLMRTFEVFSPLSVSVGRFCLWSSTNPLEIDSILDPQTRSMIKKYKVSDFYKMAAKAIHEIPNLTV